MYGISRMQYSDGTARQAENHGEEYLLTEHPVGFAANSFYYGEKIICAWTVDSMFFNGVQAGISYNAGGDWCTPMYISEEGVLAKAIITSSYAFITWSEFDSTLQTWQLYGRRGTFITTPVTEDEHSPQSITLEQNYPNPFNPHTAVGFSLLALGNVSLKVYDIFGKEVATLVSEKKEAGKYTAEWNAEGLASGIYFTDFP